MAKESGVSASTLTRIAQGKRPDVDIRRICNAFLAFEETEQSKIFPNEAFGYWKVTVERPLHVEGIEPERAYTAKEIRELRSKAARRESAAPVIKRIHRSGVEPDPLRGLFPATIGGKPAVVEYEPDPTCGTPNRFPCCTRAASTAS